MPSRKNKIGQVAVGHPVDVATGVQFTAWHDIELDGVFPLVFRRLYSTALLDRSPSVLGHGWSHHFDTILVRDLDGFALSDHDGSRVGFDDLDGQFASTGSLLNAGESMELRREGNTLVVYHWHGPEEPVVKHIFLDADGSTIPIVGRELPSGQGLLIRYDARGRVETVTQKTEGRELLFSYNEAGLLSELYLRNARAASLPPALLTRYEYDDRRRLIAVYDAMDVPHEYRYDDAGRLVLERGRGGSIYRMAYDHRGRCVETAGENGYNRRRLIYESASVTRVLDSVGNETVYQFNGRGQVEHQIFANGAGQSTQFDVHGRISVEIDPLGATTSYSYDERGDLIIHTIPNGASRAFEYDEFHQPVKITDVDGAISRMRYERGALVEVVDASGRKVRYVRSDRNDVVGVITATSRRIAIHTDDAWTEETLSDDYGVIRSQHLNLLLKPTDTSDALGVTLRCKYDRLGRPVETIRPLEARRIFEYNDGGFLVRMLDARGNERTARYSPYGKCLQEVDPLGHIHTFGWDTEGRLTSIRNPRGETAELQYDSVGNLASIRRFDDQIERMERDLAGRVIRRSKPDGTVLEYERDASGKVLRIIVDGRELRRTTYNARGAPVQAQTADALVCIDYEPGGRISAEVQNGERIEFGYDARGLLTRRAWTASEAGPVVLDYDSRGRLLSFGIEGAVAQSFSYNAGNQRVRRLMGYAREELEYDAARRLRTQRVTRLGARAYRYDAEGAVLEVLDGVRGRTAYHYDAGEYLRRSVSDALGTHHYAYDASGNLTQRDEDVICYGEGNLLQRIGTIELRRDANARVTSAHTDGQERRYQWNALGQLVSVTHPDGAVTTFGYDAFGRRVFKEHAGIRTEYWWAGDDLLAERTEQQVTEYAIWNAWPEALWENGQIRHVVTSHHGIPHELIDEAGSLVWQAEYDDWGRVVSERGTATCRLRLPGQLADRETGLHYNRFRYYCPEAGQFISPDPIGLAGGLNLFLYAPNTINWVDPYGLYCEQSGRPVWRTPEEWAEHDHDVLRDRLREENKGYESGRHDQYPGAMRDALRALADEADRRGDLPDYGQRLRQIAETYAKRAREAHRGGR